MRLFEGADGERGQRGDMGHEGPRGLAGGTDPDDLDRLVVQTTSQALAENRLRWWDTRLLLIFAFIIAGLAGVFLTLDRQADRARHDVAVLCEQDNSDSRRFNDLVDSLVESVRSNPARTPAEREAIAQQYASARQTIAQCPPP